MPPCHHCTATDAHFGPARAAGDLERYHRRGPDTTTRFLLTGLRATGLRGASLLDVGAGVGVLHHELLDGVIDSATHVEAASAYVAAAQAEDERRGHRSGIQYLVGDAVDLADRLPPADLLALDRVICCYPDWETLVRKTIVKARRVVGFSMPHARWYVRLLLGWENLVRRVRGNSFRTFVHPVSAVHRVVEEAGFRRQYFRNTLVWHVAVYIRRDVT